MELNYLKHYPEATKIQVLHLIEKNLLGDYLLNRHPGAHAIRTDKALYDFAVDLKNTHLRKSQPLSKVCYDNKLHVIHDALGLHTFISRVQGKKLKSKNEIRIASIFKKSPEGFLRMIVVHELAHLKEKAHNKAFYSLCEHMEPEYHRLEFELRLYLTHLELFGGLYET